MNRADLQTLSNTRIREASLLLKAGEYSGAYYLSGYAVECAIKACFAKKVRRYDFPDKDAKKIFTHNLSDLMNFAGLNVDLAAATKSDSNLNASWLFVKNWTEESRYLTWTQNDAEAMIRAIIGKTDGVLPWIKRHW